MTIGASITVAMQSAVNADKDWRDDAYCEYGSEADIVAATVTGLEFTVWVLGDAVVAVAVSVYWMLFAVGGNGVPSYAKTVFVALQSCGVGSCTCMDMHSSRLKREFGGGADRGARAIFDLLLHYFFAWCLLLPLLFENMLGICVALIWQPVKSN